MALDGIAEKAVEMGKEKELTYSDLMDDIYSMIYMASSCSAAFWFSFFVFAFQMKGRWPAETNEVSKY
jgi:hypothetical protein